MALTPHQKRLKFILDTYGKKYPREAADTVGIIVDSTNYWDWLGSGPDPVQAARKVLEHHYQPRRHALDRHTRWVFAQVRKAWSRSRLPWSHWPAEEELRIRTNQSDPSGWQGISSAYTDSSHRKGVKAQMWHFSVRKRLLALQEALPEIVEWAEAHPNSSPRGSWQRMVTVARNWHQAEIQRALMATDLTQALGQAHKVGELGGEWTLEALTTAAAIKAEGAALVHCIGGPGYVSGALNGRILLYSLRHNGEPKVSFEIDPKSLQIKQAKGYRNWPAGHFSPELRRGKPRAADMKTLQQLATVADVEVLSKVLQVAQMQKWRWNSTSTDMEGVTALQRILLAAVEAQAKAEKKAKKGQRSPRRADYLTHQNAAELFKRAKDPRKGLLFVWWGQKFTLRREDRQGTIVYSLWQAPRKKSVERPLITRDVPENMLYSTFSWWGQKSPRVETAEQYMRDKAFPALEVWPTKWVLRASEWAELSQIHWLTPAEILHLNKGLVGSWIGVQAKKASSGSRLKPDWLLWQIPEIPEHGTPQQIVIEINRKGYPTDIRLEVQERETVGKLRWPKRYREEGSGLVRVTKHRVSEGYPGSGFENLPWRSRDGRWLEDDAE